MEGKDNIDFFDELTGKILARLYEAFPVRALLKSADFVDNPTTYSDAVMADVASKESEFFMATAEWLQRAGYIEATMSDRSRLYIHGAVLTAKGLEVLKVRPDNLSTGPTLGERMTSAARSGAMDTVRTSVGQALSMGVRLAMGQ
ncbi:hypothetical protein [Kushneria phyllosphaerae]|uniref:Uncharacterized protein n=1 Tax=Kushneria phyllosphaerae TaxID=2100822 RepID=A0A2R8CKP1_9GAMM|nr:hypothetical protein [Kushneria phyllosphaerae]SPJ33466.1 hypothetical protein KSP9073_01475 [Kushneria phyllosphaerae]